MAWLSRERLRAAASWLKRQPAVLRLPLRTVQVVVRGLRMAPSLIRNAGRMRRLGLDAKAAGQCLRYIALAEHMGDMVACEPVIRYLLAHGVDRIVWVTDRRYAGVLRYHPDIQAIIGITCLTEWRLLRSLLRPEQVVDLNLAGRRCAWFWLPYHKQNPGGDQIDVDNYYLKDSLLGAMSVGAGLPRLDDTPRYYPGPAAHALALLQQVGPAFVVFHCESNDPERTWPAERFNALAQALLDHTSLSIVEIGLHPVLRPARGRIHDFCGKIALPSCGRVIEQAALFVGIDSGFAHMANAMGTPSVILLAKYRHFGHTYLPYSGRMAHGENTVLVRHNGPLAELDAGQVVTAVRSLITPAWRDDPAAASLTD